MPDAKLGRIRCTIVGLHKMIADVGYKDSVHVRLFIKDRVPRTEYERIP